MAYDKSQKLNYLKSLEKKIGGLLDFLDDWKNHYDEYGRAGLSDDLSDDDLSNSVYENTSAADIKTSVSAGNSIYEVLMDEANIAAWRGQLETFARRR